MSKRVRHKKLSSANLNFCGNDIKHFLLIISNRHLSACDPGSYILVGFVLQPKRYKKEVDDDDDENDGCDRKKETRLRERRSKSYL